MAHPMNCRNLLLFDGNLGLSSANTLHPRPDDSTPANRSFGFIRQKNKYPGETVATSNFFSCDRTTCRWTLLTRKNKQSKPRNVFFFLQPERPILFPCRLGQIAVPRGPRMNFPSAQIRFPPRKLPAHGFPFRAGLQIHSRFDSVAAGRR